MKKKIAVISQILILAAVLIFYILYLIWNSGYVLAKRFFNIDIYKYDAVVVENTLSNLDYSGKYEMTMEVGEEQFDEFAASLELEKIDEKDELERINKEYFEGKALDEGGIFFGFSWPAKSNILSPFFCNGMPKSVYMAVRYEEPENGSYRVRLIYKE